MKRKYTILVTEEFEEWLEREPAKSRVQIAKRIDNIKRRRAFWRSQTSKRPCLGTSRG
jgi:hypothetical protein